MLRHLYIQGFTLIDKLDIEIKSGFTVITGETGAGKSIVLGALGLLLGNRADAKSIKTGCDKCIIEATFDLTGYNLRKAFDNLEIDYDEEECIIRREIKSNGKSRAFINDTPVQLTDLKEIGSSLVDIHSQHQNLLLKKEDFQLSVVDVIAKDAELLTKYKEEYGNYIQAKHILEEKNRKIEEEKANEEFIRYQYEELYAAGIIEGEQDELEKEIALIEHNEEIKESLYTIDQVLSSGEENVSSMLRIALQNINSISKYDESIDHLSSRLDSCHIELKDIAQEISALTEKIDFDPSRQEWINDRLSQLYTLEKKHHVGNDTELLRVMSEYKEQLTQIDDSEEMLREAKENVDKYYEKCVQLSAILTKEREKASKVITKDLLRRLASLNMLNAQFEVNISSKQLSENGADKVTFMFSANKGVPVQPITEVASGGEISRVMLSLKAMISDTVKQPTIIFDEIDTGVSGQTAENMARIMLQMAKAGRQVISITHLPQIAAMGDNHLIVKKIENNNGTESNMQMLSDKERVSEIARMLSGSKITQAAIDNANNLLKIKEQA